MASTTIPAFIAASFCHVHSTAPLLPTDQPLLMQNDSSDLFTNPFLFAHSCMLSLGATAINADPSDEQENLSPKALEIPDIALLYKTHSAAALQPIAKNNEQSNQAKIPCKLG
jgi:hypothetical protein